MCNIQCAKILTYMFVNIGLSPDFVEGLTDMEQEVKYQTQDLLSALYKVKKYRVKDYERLNAELQGKYKIYLLFVL